MTAEYFAPPTRPAPVPTPTTNAILDRDAFGSSSSPLTPRKWRTRGARSKTGPRVFIGTSNRETFLDDVTPVDGVNGTRGNDSGDDQDPHDLTFSPKHVTRASVVDNMLLALDKFSNPILSTAASRESPNASLRYNPIIGRSRGNTFTSDLSSDNESKVDENTTPNSFQCSRRSNSDSNCRYLRSLPPVSSLYEEEALNSRHRVFDSQRAFAGSDQRYGGKSRKNSASSSVDLGQALSGNKLGPAGHRRSLSSDFISDGRSFPTLVNDLDVASSSYTLADEIEAAPTPIIHAGPRRHHSPARDNYPVPLTPKYDLGSMGKLTTTKSSKNQCARKGKIGTMVIASTKGRDEVRDLHDNAENIPPMPTYFPQHPPNPVFGPRKPSIASSADLASQSTDRPGFFRRVFGSKSASETTLQGTESGSGSSREGMTILPPESLRGHASMAKLHKESLKETNLTGTALPKEQQTISKKSSAFFRRRKKSVSERMATSIPVPLQSVKLEAAEPSPVSSLRQVMNPYLGGPPLPSPDFDPCQDSLHAFHMARTSSSQHNEASLNRDPKIHTSNSQSDRVASQSLILESQFSSKPRVPRVDHQGSTFFADSSGTEETNTLSRQGTLGETSDGRSRTSPLATSQGPGSEGLPPLNLPFVSASNSGATTPSSGSRAPQSPSSSTAPNIPEPNVAVASTTTRPLISCRQQEASDSSTESSLSRDREASPSSKSLLPSGSDPSLYKSAPSTPVVTSEDNAAAAEVQAPNDNTIGSSKTTQAETHSEDEREQALKIFENRDENLDPSEVSAWLGDAGDARERVRMAYMNLFDWTNADILSALRGLCARIALKGETQQVDRMLDAFAKRWCDCNCNHGFKSTDVVHAICYSILLLNTDLHLADIGQKMTRTQFIRNTIPTIRCITSDSASDGPATIRVGTWPHPDTHANGNHSSLPRSNTLPVEPRAARISIDEAIPIFGSARPAEKLVRDNSGDMENSSIASGSLVTTPFVGSVRAWEAQLEIVLKRIYTSISRDRLPLFGAKTNTLEVPSNLLSFTSNMLRRSPSTLSKAVSEHSRGRAAEHRLGAGRWVSKPRSRPKIYPVSTGGSTRTSMDEGSSAWSPSMSSTWSKASLGKTLTSMSVDSFGSESLRGDYQKSIGFANALSQAIIREESTGIFSSNDEGIKAAPLLDDESLELSGAPWAKEGSLKHKHHLEGVERRAKGRSWNECFAVIEKGWMRLFSFSVNAKSVRAKAKDRAKAGGVVGGGNWMDSAEEVCKFLLRQTIASALPEPGYSKARPYVWALSLPTGAVHLFHVGTPDIVKEFVSTANYWSARLSKEPMMGGISNTEYGWSEALINRALISSESRPRTGGSRPSMQSSIRSSFDQVGGGMRPKLPGDKITISEWSPPQQSMLASQLMEVDQLRTLQAYVKNVEDELAKHNELRLPMQLAFSTRHPNTTKAMANWEKKSSYLLREIVKFKTYVDSLLLAQKEKERVLKTKAEDER